MSRKRIFAILGLLMVIAIAGVVLAPLIGANDPRTQGGLLGGAVSPGQEPPIAHLEPTPPPPPPPPPAPNARRSITTSAPPVDTHVIVPVYFATNRALNPDAVAETPASQFLDEDGDLIWGNGTVSIPRVHQMGVLESQSWLGAMLFDPDPEKHVILQSMTPVDLDALRTMVRADLADSDNSVLMYVHGYNTSLDKAMRRTGQLTYDLGWNGASFLFSWPSQGEALDYFKDSTLAERSVFAMRDTLAELAQLDADRIVIIAHSMGTRVLSKGLAELARDDPAAAARMTTVILAAPDIDERVFHEQLAPRFQTLSDIHFTLYASAEDSALKVSKQANGFARIGDTTNGVPELPGIDVIDATGVVSDFFGHTYFGDNATILSDIFTMVHDDLPVDQRPLVQQVMQGEQPVWKIIVD